jgi:hypothetical protein
MELLVEGRGTTALESTKRQCLKLPEQVAALPQRVKLLILVLVEQVLERPQ